MSVKPTLLLGTTLFAFTVIVLGAYTRLTDAGLGCPDWPGCYGHFIVPEHSTHIKDLIPIKAWTEMIHRYVAGTLGLAILGLFILSLNQSKTTKFSYKIPLTLVILVIFQALLGMWTVTLKLLPLVVMAHLMGGFTILALLWWWTLNSYNHALKATSYSFKNLSFLKVLGIVAVFILILQLLLGGWTSANYAALVCLDFPFCQKTTFSFDFKHAFNFVAAGIENSQGVPLSAAAQMTIHMTHRCGAFLTSIVIGLFAWKMIKNTQSLTIRRISIIMISLLIMQIILGISNVIWILPLPIAVAHNAMGALLLLSVIALNYYLFHSTQDQSYEAVLS